MNTDFMQKALDIAIKSGNEIPVGAVIVKDGEILSTEHNLKEKLNDVTAHAEILAIRKASEKLSNWRLNGCEMYVTLEPCPMCMWAILQARIDKLYFGSYDTLNGAVSCLPEMIKIANSKIKIKGGIMESDCDYLLKQYFEKLR